MLAAASWTREGSRLLSRLARLLAEAARRDPYLERLSGGSVGSHCHGYGYALLARSGGSWRVSYERFDAAGLSRGPSGEEGCEANLDALNAAVEGLAAELDRAGEAYLVLHARRAGRREPRGTLNAHPFHAAYTAPWGPGEVFLAHNGGVDKAALAGEAGVASGDTSLYTDSHLLALAIARRLSRGEPPGEALASLWRAATSGYDVALLTAGRGGPRLWLAAGASPSILGDEARLAYYQPVLLLGDGLAGFASSTVADLASAAGLPLALRRLAPREWGVYRVEPGGWPRLEAPCPRGSCGVVG